MKTYPAVLESLLDQPPLYGVEGGGVLDAVILHRVGVVVTLADFTCHSAQSTLHLFCSGNVN